uniref:Kinesin light chain n=1 Tax=Hanusia phi TaxID=3032 RepID=A0A7S0ER61_9CRYP
MSSSKASLDEIQEKNHFLENELQTAKAELTELQSRNLNVLQEGILQKMRSKEEEMNKELEELKTTSEAREAQLLHDHKLELLKEAEIRQRESTQLVEELKGLYSNFAAVSKKAGDLPKSIQMYRRALVLHEQAHGENTVEAATLNINLGAALLAAGESAESKRHFQTALDIRCKHLGEEHQQTQAAMKWLAKLQSKNDQTSRPPSATPTPEGS